MIVLLLLLILLLLLLLIVIVIIVYCVIVIIIDYYCYCYSYCDIVLYCYCCYWCYCYCYCYCYVIIVVIIVILYWLLLLLLLYVIMLMIIVIIIVIVIIVQLLLLCIVIIEGSWLLVWPGRCWLNDESNIINDPMNDINDGRRTIESYWPSQYSDPVANMKSPSWTPNDVTGLKRTRKLAIGNDPTGPANGLLKDNWWTSWTTQTAQTAGLVDRAAQPAQRTGRDRQTDRYNQQPDILDRQARQTVTDRPLAVAIVAMTATWIDQWQWGTSQPKKWPDSWTTCPDNWRLWTARRWWFNGRTWQWPQTMTSQWTVGSNED